MKMKLCIAALTGLFGFALSEGGAATNETGGDDAANMNAAIFKNLSDIKWGKILPELGADSPEISILHVDPKTQATKLLVRTSSAIHIRKHWHTANETHTLITGTAAFACDGKRVEMGPGSFNYMPAKMIHEAWLPANSLTFITVDGAWDVNWVEGPPTAADLTK
jgi:mannose-6-phosphate isomerase-like protein (cupin superfamily)